MSPSRSSWPEAATRRLGLGHRDVVAARVLADVDADRVAAERVERHLADRLAAGQVVADRVDVRRGVVRRDDQLGVERRPARGRVRVHDVPHDLRGREERMELALARERLRQVDDAACHVVLPLSCHLAADLDDARNDGGDHALARLEPGSSRVADHAGCGDVAEHVHRHDDLGAGVPHAVLAERRPLAARPRARRRRDPRRRASPCPSRRAGRAPSRSTSRPPRRGSSGPRRRPGRRRRDPTTAPGRRGCPCSRSSC